jgi:hypothetical protein
MYGTLIPEDKSGFDAGRGSATTGTLSEPDVER